MVWLFFFLLLLKFNFSSCVGKKVFSMMIMIKQLFYAVNIIPKHSFSKLHRRIFSLFVILLGLTLFNYLLQLLIDGRLRLYKFFGNH